MKILDKNELIAALKERILRAKKENNALVPHLQKLLENLVRSGDLKAI